MRHNRRPQIPKLNCKNRIKAVIRQESTMTTQNVAKAFADVLGNIYDEYAFALLRGYKSLNPVLVKPHSKPKEPKEPKEPKTPNAKGAKSSSADKTLEDKPSRVTNIKQGLCAVGYVTVRQFGEYVVGRSAPLLEWLDTTTLKSDQLSLSVSAKQMHTLTTLFANLKEIKGTSTDPAVHSANRNKLQTYILRILKYFALRAADYMNINSKCKDNEDLRTHAKYGFSEFYNDITAINVLCRSVFTADELITIAKIQNTNAEKKKFNEPIYITFEILSAELARLVKQDTMPVAGLTQNDGDATGDANGDAELSTPTKSVVTPPPVTPVA
jgi:hypothetical protein